MIEFASLLFLSFIALLKSSQRLAAENIALRHPVSVLRRKHPGRARLSRLDRVFRAWLTWLYPQVLGAIVVVKPETEELCPILQSYSDASVFR